LHRSPTSPEFNPQFVVVHVPTEVQGQAEPALTAYRAEVRGPPAAVVASAAHAPLAATAHISHDRTSCPQLLLCFARAGRPLDLLCYVRYLELSASHGYSADGELLLPHFVYTVRPKRGRGRGQVYGAVGKYARKPHYAVLPLSWIAHRVHVVPCPSLWAPTDRGKDTVCSTWIEQEDLLYHESVDA
jgi:hypothetical protein